MRKVRRLSLSVLVATIGFVLVAPIVGAAPAPIGTEVTTTTVSCSPSTVEAGTSTTCTATVKGTNAAPPAPSGTVKFASSGGTATFSPGNSCVLSPTDGLTSTCSVGFTPAGVPNKAVAATYPGDSVHRNSLSPSFAVVVTRRPTITTISCSPSSPARNEPSTCTATVTDNEPGTQTVPGGTVQWGDALQHTFSLGTCTLAATLANASACSTTFTSTTTDTHTLSARYLKNESTHAASTGTTGVKVHQRNTSTTLSCTPTTTPNGVATTCTATVTDVSGGTPSTPLSTVTFSNSDGAGTFSPTQCTTTTLSASSASCSVDFTPSGPGTQRTLAAFFTATAIHNASQSNHVVITVTEPI